MAWAFSDRWLSAYDYDTDGRAWNISRNAAGSSYGNVAAFDYFSDTAAVGEYLYFAHCIQFWAIRLFVGTAFSAASVTFAWEYQTGASSWATLPVDNPNALLSPGEQVVGFTPPRDWYAQREKGMGIRCRISALSGLTEGGANSSQVVQWNHKCLAATGTENLTNAVSADLAGSYTILPENSPAAGLVPKSMPVKELGAASTVSVILSGTSAGAGDTVALTGIDYASNPLVESIDVSAGDGTYVTTMAFRNITDVTCVGFSGGTVRVDQDRWGVIVAYNIGFYSTYNTFLFGCHLSIGDGSAATSVIVALGSLCFMTGTFFYIRNFGTLTLGTGLGWAGTAYEIGYFGVYVYQNFSQTGVSGRCHITGGSRFTESNVSLSMYGVKFLVHSFFHTRNYFDWRGGTLVCVDTTFQSVDTEAGTFEIRAGTVTLTRVTFFGVAFRLLAGVAMTGVKAGNVAGELRGSASIVVDDASFRRFVAAMYPNSVVTCLDGTLIPTSFGINWIGQESRADCYILKKRFDLRVVDHTGDGITDAQVVIKDALGNTEADVATDANGDIAQQQLFWQKGSHTVHVGLSWVNHTPHTVTISKAGYVTRELTLTMDRRREEIEMLDLELVPDTSPPEWDDDVGIVALEDNDDGHSLRVAWGSATDTESPPVRYRLYAQMDTDVGLFAPDNVLCEYPAETPEANVLGVIGQSIYMGVRAVDAEGNETDNVNSLAATIAALAPACLAQVNMLSGIVSAAIVEEATSVLLPDNALAAATSNGRVVVTIIDGPVEAKI